jgi:hypothetical protein
MITRFSPSSLSVFRDCPRCFWWEQNKKVKRPRGIFPSLPGGIDRIMKAFVEECMTEGKPVPHLVNALEAKPFKDRPSVKRWQNWRTGLTAVVDCGEFGPVTLSGAIDDLLEWPDGSVSPWDYKTKASPPKEGDSERYYGSQLDIYHTLLQYSGLQCTGKGYFTYLWPIAVLDGKSIAFDHQTITVDTDPKRAAQLAKDAIQCLHGEEPEEGGLCEYCVFLTARNG